MRNFVRIVLFLIIGGIVIYAIGPHPAKPKLLADLPLVPSEPIPLENYVKDLEGSIAIKPGNRAQIIWSDTTKKSKTHYSVVYLHGFSASSTEGSPLHKEFAARYGCNLYLSRLAGHGLNDSDAFLQVSADSLYNSAKQALAIGARLGDSVILMATSAGAALSLILAVDHAKAPIKALILYSPCIQIFDPNAWILDKPWGLQVARAVSKGKYILVKNPTPQRDSFWYAKYRIEGAVALQNLLDARMNASTFEHVAVPTLVCMYYKNKVQQDSTVKTEAIRAMFAALGTPPSQKMLKTFPNVGNHVMASYVTSKDLNAVRAATFQFADDVLKLPKH